MTKEEYLKICKKRFKGKTRKVVEDHINNFKRNKKLLPDCYIANLDGKVIVK